MTLTLDQIRTFLSVLERKGFTGAAREHAVSQPAVSTRVKTLEAELGAPLFRRTRGGVSLTEAGRRFLPAAREIVRLVDEVRADVRGGKGALSRPLRIGATDTASTHLLPGAIRRYRGARPGGDVRVLVASSRPLILGLLRDELDLALVTLPVKRSDIRVTPLLREDLWIVTGRAGGMSRAPRIGLAEVPYLAYPRGSTTRRIVDRALHEVSLPAIASMEGGNPGVLRELARAGVGFAVLPRVLVEGDVRARRLVRHQPVGFRATREIGLARRSAGPPSAEALGLVDALRGVVPAKEKELRAFVAGPP